MPSVSSPKTRAASRGSPDVRDLLGEGVRRPFPLTATAPGVWKWRSGSEPADPGLGFRLDAFAFRGELREDLELFFLAEDLSEELDVFLEALFFLLEDLGSFLVLPDLGGGEAQVNGIPLGVLAI